MKERKHIRLKELTPYKYRCGVAAVCPAVFSIGEKGDKLAIVGKKADPKELGIADKVGKDEQVIIVDRGMIEALAEK